MVDARITSAAPEFSGDLALSGGTALHTLGRITSGGVGLSIVSKASIYRNIVRRLRICIVSSALAPPYPSGIPEFLLLTSNI